MNLLSPRKKYRYETHLHTAPVSACAKAYVIETLNHYKSMGYAGVCITNHFIDGNINISKARPYKERIEFCFSDYEKAYVYGQLIQMSVFCGVEMTYQGADFLVYGLKKNWYLAHPEIETMPRKQLLDYLRSNGALVIHAHPFREGSHIDHINLYPRNIDGVEIYNATQADLLNEMAQKYAEHYGLIPFAGSDNHVAGKQTRYGGMECDAPVLNDLDFVAKVKNKALTPFNT